MELLEHERLDYLMKEHLRIIQNDEVFSFSTDALLLGHFTEVRKNDSIMDLCSGNGVVPLLLSYKTKRQIDGIEIQHQLIDMANRSIAFNQLTAQIQMYEMDLKAVRTQFKPSQYSLVTCNPPYFKSNQLHQHQKNAHKIARHEIMCSLEDCCIAARHLLKQGGRLVMVHRAERLMDVLSNMRDSGIEPKKLYFVYSKKEKDAQTIVVEGRKGGNQGLTIQPPFYIYNEDGTYTSEMREVYYG
ncbi:tRNA1(Val) (adenine(37)-N6)-methyltransferase [Staphylococcus sp. 18_1_E_LY]|uniref:tRNA1(Val) (Adenine(37)-N6)-methyltransferase n=1 Tax=Staphylococcus lloydii TaxID=2781774 RepID=A0A7T1AZH9_9STAP|nr:tRNA1(Val) (adenine(37)-N6)-methyltransferase [Staphylococcus lloydii]MBF7020731.1 tRNA1(Val) (adenine(37)-N6)-methyltransferase [Staphylococcus lloydii]MBF7028414.1 tRNA1(Val) (adenine(37)-N6)-methyltransferase [Staphylococcus lloydii]QPM74937.1 tRNA1(Val) (adenine(37)-N6)-methyltransferase [Staphylococcus lloydii]